MKNCENEIITLTTRFFLGETTIEEERRLYELYQWEQLPPALEQYREMMLSYGALAEEQVSVERITIRKNHFRIWSILLAAASIAFIVGFFLWSHNVSQEECVAYIYGERVTNKTVVMHQMTQVIADFTEDDAIRDAEQQLKELFEE